MAPADRDDIGERTEQPSELRLADARRRGRVARSIELASAASAVGAAIALGLAAPGLLNEMTKMTATFLDARSASVDVRAGELGKLLVPAVAPTLKVAAGLLAACAGLAALAAFVQVGPLVSAERVTLDWGRLGIRAGLDRLVSLRTLVRAAGTLGKVAAVSAVGYWAFRPIMARLAAAGGLSPRVLAGEAGNLAWAAAMCVGGCLLALGLLDYLFEWWQHRGDLRMSRRDLKEEEERAEGDWRLRHRRRDIGRKLVKRVGMRNG